MFIMQKLVRLIIFKMLYITIYPNNSKGLLSKIFIQISFGSKLLNFSIFSKTLVSESVYCVVIGI